MHKKVKSWQPHQAASFYYAKKLSDFIDHSPLTIHH
jgi:hypothetical protein